MERKKNWTNILMYGCSPIQGKRPQNDGKLQDKSVPFFKQELVPGTLDLKTVIH